MQCQALSSLLSNGKTGVAYQPGLRTSNSLEGLSSEVKHRTRVATFFPISEPLLRLAPSVIMEISEDWEASRAYLRMDIE